MKTFSFTLETKSYLLAASGEGSALIDVDVVFHRSGFPFIPARRIKGLLKESMEEVLEIQGKNNEEIEREIHRYFGIEGSDDVRGCLRFKNLYPPDWENIKKYYKNPDGTFVLDPEFVKKFYTAEITQTAIDDEGVAEDKSLRNYRLIKPNKVFKADFECDDSVNGFDISLLEKAVKNLRYAGTRRNRGFGKIKCSIGEFCEISNKFPAPQLPDKIKAIKVCLETLSPVIIAQQIGEQNTVDTAKNISGNQLRGILIKNYLKNKEVDNKKLFELFLSGKLQFHGLTFESSSPLPLNIHEFKGFKNKAPIDVFTKVNAKDNDQELMTRAIGGYGKIYGKKLHRTHPRVSFFFHNTRKHRALGRNTQDIDEGGIFYYEALEEDQTFNGLITGDEKLLVEIFRSFPHEFKASLGRSRSAQYGDVLIKLEAETENQDKKTDNNTKFLITCLSPLILLNENGMPEPTANYLIKTLESSLTLNNVNIENIAASFTFIEQYNSLWAAKSGKIPAFKEGSTFLITTENTQLPVEFSLGLMQEQGFGRMKAEVYYDDGKCKCFELETREINNENILDEPQKKIEQIKALPLLKNIQEEYEKQKNNTDIQLKAIIDAAKLHKDYKGKLKGHLISRLEIMLKNAPDENYINNWFKDINKQAMDTLKTVELIDEDGKFCFKIDQSFSFQDSKLYWLTFLQTLRKYNKHE